MFMPLGLKVVQSQAGSTSSSGAAPRHHQYTGKDVFVLCSALSESDTLTK